MLDKMLSVFGAASLLNLFTPAIAALTKDISLLSENATVVPAIIVSLAILVIVCVVMVFSCTDCYNAEVSTSTHQACRGSKSGGGAYYPTNTSDVNEGVMQSAYRTNEYVSTPTDNAPLPYTMIPTHIPEDAGFSGYSTTPTTTPGYGAGNAGGLAGYGGGGAGGSTRGYGSPSSPAGYGAPAHATAPVRTGTHINPMDTEDPPPSYGEALQGWG